MIVNNEFYGMAGYPAVTAVPVLLLLRRQFCQYGLPLLSLMAGYALSC